MFKDGSILARIASVQQQADECGTALITAATGDALAALEFCEAVSTITAEFRHKVAEMLVIGLLLEAMLPRVRQKART